MRPADKDPQYSTDYAIWQRTCAKLWTPLLEKAKCQLIITAHQHCYRYDAPTKDRPWAQMIGGGPELPSNEQGDDTGKYPQLFPTVIDGEVVGGRLRITAYNLRTGKVQQTVEFKPRKR